MKVIILGATGGTGLEVVRQALAKGHSVTAFVRSIGALNKYADRVDIREGDLLDSLELQTVIKGHDAVLSAFGPRPSEVKKKAGVFKQFANALTAAMPETGVKRVVQTSTAFLFTNSIIPPANLIGRIFFPDIVDDAAAMENTFRHSLTDWTIVRPTWLTDKPYTGKYRVLEGRLPPYGFSVSRADVADCMLKVVDNPVRYDKVLGVSS